MILTPEDTLVVNLNISDDVLVCFEKVVFWTVSEDFIVLLLCKAVTLFLETLAPEEMYRDLKLIGEESVCIKDVLFCRLCENVTASLLRDDLILAFVELLDKLNVSVTSRDLKVFETL